ncbi:protein adenylyltransferase SelO [Ramlibacter alkalitolerans]|uniref:Protein nucleotidyltransferase YdiU n=1 Tax=Ramlibacter alkalitolerans TaxID=2039631 RepID=A0ABS1JH14_9BURK|nr:YdiU family protein [Ramlibacter alkalitolerans]MBL0423518.1 YdiU family protein [Ramlibacter alkalitolerans]
MHSAGTSLFRFDNSYARELPGLYVPWKPAEVPAPRLLFLNEPLAEELGLDADSLRGQEGAAIFAGNSVPEGAEPLAQAYAGHQFGGFSPQLGDGRALLLGEVVDRHGRRRDIAFKGSGRTPFSRGGDGKAAVGPMLREVLIGEAMHALGIPTTRALAVASTGEPVVRERLLPGAVLARVAASHLRVGTFQFFAARGEIDKLRQLAEYAIARHDPELAGTPGRYLALLARVAQRQAALIAQWMNVGFIHGVMNTDNMTLSGETIDYGPCAFLEAYDPQTVFSSIDQQGRYAYGNQPLIARWNLARFAEALLPLVVADEGEAAAEQAVAQATRVIEEFPGVYEACLLRGQRAKLGLAEGTADDAADAKLANDWLALLHANGADFTLAWRGLADAATGDAGPLQALIADAQALQDWLARWRERCAADGVAPQQRAQAMRRVNPWIIPRNHRVEEALAAASEHEDLGPFERLLAALREPYQEDPERAAYAQAAPAALTACYQTFCGT